MRTLYWFTCNMHTDDGPCEAEIFRLVEKKDMKQEWLDQEPQTKLH
jgi:hypothetical protein